MFTNIHHLLRFLLLDNNELYGIGKNGWNQLGISHGHNNRNIHHSVNIKYFEDRDIILKQIACSKTYSIFLSEKGKLYSCGKGKDGGLGLGKMSWTESIQRITGLKQRILNVVCGTSHTLALNYKSQCFSWGII